MFEKLNIFIKFDLIKNSEGESDNEITENDFVVI